MSTTTYVFNTTGTALLNYLAAVPLSHAYRVLSVTCNFNAAPVSAENFTITWDNHNGAVYDLLLYTLDPGTTGTSDILWQPDEELILTGEDAIWVQYDNTDARIYGVTVTYKAV